MTSPSVSTVPSALRRSRLGPPRVSQLALVALLVALLGLAPAPWAVAGVSNQGDTAAAWPTTWNGGRYSTGALISDVNGDQTPANLDIGSGPCTGTACTGTSSSVYYASDGTTAFFRLRMTTDITDISKGGLVGGAFLTQIALASTDTVVAVVGVDGKSASADSVYVATAPGTSVVPIYTYPFDTSGGQNSAGMRVVPDGNGQYFLDYQVPFARLQDAAAASGATSFSTSTPVKLYFGTPPTSPSWPRSASTPQRLRSPRPRPTCPGRTHRLPARRPDSPRR
jgi:hypothetical protein